MKHTVTPHENCSLSLSNTGAQESGINTRVGHHLTKRDKGFYSLYYKAPREETKKHIIAPWRRDLHCPLDKAYADLCLCQPLSYSKWIRQGSVWPLRSCRHSHWDHRAPPTSPKENGGGGVLYIFHLSFLIPRKIHFHDAPNFLTESKAPVSSC